ncbi:MAG: glycosyltransferase [bacterium]|nr:glycosyltransferase [bacterium]
MNKKILILYTSVGLGHKFNAQNIGYHLEQAGYEVKLHDVLQLQSGLIVKLGEMLHKLVNQKFPFIWRWLYLSENFNRLTLRLRVPLAGRNNAHVKKVVDEFKPDVVITTQTTASAVMAYLKREKLYTGKLIIAFSDYHLHEYWLYDEADLYLANIEEQKAEMKHLGVAPDKIAVCGITLKPKEVVDLALVRTALSVKAQDKVVLVASGSLGIGFTPELLSGFVRVLVSELKAVKVVLVCGKNIELQKSLKKMNLPQTTVLGFYDRLRDLYQIADVFITKPGGLTIAEALQAGTRMVITHWLPGQEELNYNYLLEHTLIDPVLQPLTADNLAKTVHRLLSTDIKSETVDYSIITQKNHEGVVLLQAVKSLFHNV